MTLKRAGFIFKRMITAYRIRLYPNAAQRIALEKQFGSARWLFNWGLEKCRAHYLETGKTFTYQTLTTFIPGVKKENPWLAEADSQVLQQSLQNLVRAYERFFKKMDGYPNYKPKKSHQSIRYPQRFKIIERRLNGWGACYLPKVGKVRAMMHRPLEGAFKSAIVSLDRAGRYWASLIIEKPEAQAVASSLGAKAIGIDLGIIHNVVTSDGRKIESQKFRKRAEKNLRRKYQAWSRKKKGSKNKEKARKALARAHSKIVFLRKDFLHKLSRQLVNENQVICVEDLNVQAITRNKLFAKHVRDCGWTILTNFLKYKAEGEGKRFVKVDRWFPSSKTCNACGHIVPSLPLETRRWTCSVCQADHDRDINAARNIRDEGLRILAVG